MLRDRTTKRSFKPGARIMVLTNETPVVEGAGAWVNGVPTLSIGRKPEWLEITDFLDVTVTNAIGRVNTANITLSNNKDKYYGSGREVSKSTQRQREIVEYLKRVLSISEVLERNIERRESFFKLLKKGRIDKDAVGKKYYSEDENGFLRKSGYVPGSRSEEYANYEFTSLDLDLMRRVWIDFRDRNDEWVAGFTGYISSILPVFTPGQMSTLTLGCKGMSAILQRSEIVITEALEPKGQPFRKGEFASPGWEELTNSLAGLDGDQIIEKVVTLARDIYSYNTPGAVARGKQQGDYFYQEKLWSLAGDEYPAGSGIVLPNNIGYGDRYVAYNPSRSWSSRSSVASMIGKLIIDPEIGGADSSNYKVFQQAIQTAFQLYKNKSMYAYNICQEAAEIVGYEFFEDAKGNLVFQSPKYDKLPRFDSENEEIGGPRQVTLSSPTFDVDGQQIGLRFTENYSNVPFHGRDYIIDDIGLKTRRYTYTEDGVVTHVTAHATIEWMNITDEIINAECFAGSTSYPEIAKLNRELADQIIRLNKRYGVRRHELNPMITGGISNKELLNRFALQQLVKINSGAVLGSIDMNQRPDICIGRTVFLVEDQKLAYVIGTTNTCNRSSQQPHGTTLSLAYIHHPSQLVGVPWQLATAQELSFELPGSKENPLI